MTPNEFQKECLRTEKTRVYMLDVDAVMGPEIQTEDGQIAKTPDHLAMSRLDHAARGMVTEAGELVDMLKKHHAYGKKFDKVNALEEVGDTLWYVSLALDACGFTLEQAMDTVVTKLRKRFPEGFSQDKALNRDLDAERAILESKAAEAK